MSSFLNIERCPSEWFIFRYNATLIHNGICNLGGNHVFPVWVKLLMILCHSEAIQPLLQKWCFLPCFCCKMKTDSE